METVPGLTAAEEWMKLFIANMDKVFSQVDQSAQSGTSEDVAPAPPASVPGASDDVPEHKEARPR